MTDDSTNHGQEEHQKVPNELSPASHSNDHPLDHGETGDTSSSSSSSSSSSVDIRRDVVGKATVEISDYINDNLLVVRSVAMATIGILTLYGISQTPLFFRYRTVADIPSTLFRDRRKKIPGRLLRSEMPTEANQLVRVYVRHLSPLERILPKSMFETILKWHPSAAIGVRPQTNKRDLLQVEIAGIRSTEYYPSSSSNDAPGEWLHRLATEHTNVTMELLGRRIVWKEGDEQNEQSSSPSSSSMDVAKKRKIPESLLSTTDKNNVNENATQIAVARLYYRPKPTQFFPTDVGYSLVRLGRANICVDGLYGSGAASSTGNTGSRERLMDASEDIKDLQADAKYMEKLARAEYEAAAESRGMWSDPSIRQRRSDVINEVNFQETATWWQKLWRRVRGG